MRNYDAVCFTAKRLRSCAKKVVNAMDMSLKLNTYLRKRAHKRLMVGESAGGNSHWPCCGQVTDASFHNQAPVKRVTRLRRVTLSTAGTGSNSFQTAAT